MIHPSHGPEARTAWWALSLLALGLVLALWLPAPQMARGLAQYVPLHTTLEVFSISVAVLVFAVGWSSQRYRPSEAALWASTAFLGVGLLDLLHTLSYAGMPDFITPSGPEKAINFWFAARALAALALLAAAGLSWRRVPRLPRWVALTSVLGLVGVGHVFLWTPDWMPRTFIPGQGLTPFKLAVEYALIAAYLLAALLLLWRLRQPREFNAGGLLMAAAAMAMSEFFFTRYADVTDLYNLLGHVYKIVAYAFLYWALFVETLQRPYQALRASQAQLQGTLSALPDLLFEMDVAGNYQAIHAGPKEALLADTRALVGRNVRDVMPEAAARTCLQALGEAHREGQSRGARLTLEVASGTRHFELSIGRSRSEAGDGHHLLVLSRDVTPIVEQERALAHEARLSAALLTLPDASRRLSEQEVLRHALEQACELTDSTVAVGYLVTAESLTGGASPGWTSAAVSRDPALAAPWQDPVPVQPWAQALQQHTLCLNQLEARHPLLTRWLAVPVIEDGQVRAVVGVGNKATGYDPRDQQTLRTLADRLWTALDRRRQERALQAKQAELDHFFSANLDLFCIGDTQGTLLRVNGAWEAMAGVPAGQLLGRHFLDFIHPDDRAATFAAFDRLKQRDSVVDFECRWLRLDGEVRHIEWRARGSGQLFYASARDVTDKRASAARIHHLSHYDQLTGLPNRLLLQQEFEHALDTARRHGNGLALVYVDLDHFKAINEALGPAMGDQLLRTLAWRLRSHLRDQDTLCRPAGDEFIVLLPGSDQRQAATTVEALLHALQDPLTLAGQEISVGASAGIAVYPNDGDHLDGLQMAAESAMYQAKQVGRNAIRFYSPAMQQDAARVLALSSALKQALPRGELHLVYQPQLALDDTRVVGAEALLRWHSPQWGVVMPSEFVPLAEDNGLIVPIGDWVLRTAMRQLRQWHDSGLSDFGIAINLSALQFAQPGLAERIAGMAAEAGVPPHCVELELTEAVALQQPEAAQQTMEALVTAGFRLAIDDFGTGYSSMNYLKRFAVHKLKIDQGFVRELDANSDDCAIVTAIIQMAHSLGMSTVAEGVETEAQLDFLRRKGCDEVQGFLFSGPLDARAFADFVRQPLMVA